MQRKLVALLVLGLVFLVSPGAVVPANAGPISALVKTGGKAAGKQAQTLARQALRESIDGFSTSAWRNASAAVGADGADAVLAAGRKFGQPPERALLLASRAGNHVQQPQALEWVMRHGEAGAFFITKLGGLGNVAKVGLDRPGSDAVIGEAWQLVRGCAGSWNRLGRRMTEAGLNSTERDFAENLFKMRAEAGRHIPGMSKGDLLVPGHVGRARTGIDYIKPNRDGTLSAIEFGTGLKPARQREMSWDHLRGQLHHKLTNLTPDEKINLRAAGLDNTLLLQPDNLLDPAFPVHKFVRREIYATRKNSTLLQALEADAGGVTFHLLY